jgi:N-acyl-D-amino-acid deacylase
VHVSHLRPDRALELTAAEILALVDAGGDSTFDLYPYTHSSTFLPFLLPHWLFDGGRNEIAARLACTETREAIRREKAASRWAWNDATIAGAPSPPYAELAGLGLEDAAARVGADPVDFACDFLLAEQLACTLVWRDEETAHDRRELATMLSHPRAMIGSDGIYSGGREHPRGYGAFARFLGDFVHAEGLLPLEEAIRRVTSLPADRFGLGGRGRLEAGFAADVVVFDPDAIEPPRKTGFARGVRDVLVNGIPVFEDSALTGAQPGRGLRRAVG